MAQPQLSVQLYSVRDPLEADLDGTFGRLAEMGVRNVEAFAFVERPAEIAAALQRHGLAAPTGHGMILSDEIRFGDMVIEVPSQEDTFAAAVELGIELLIDPMVAPSRWADADAVARTAEQLNEASVAAAAQGLSVGYHNHAHEFLHSFDGVSAYEYFVARLDPAVALELDVFWAAAAGQDVPALLGRLGSRVRALHVKDGILGDGLLGPEGMPVTENVDQRPAGQGQIDLTGILGAAASVDYAIVEFDSYGGDIFDGVSQSVAYLAERGIR